MLRRWGAIVAVRSPLSRPLRRLSFFAALSVLAHAATIVGSGPFRLTGLGLGAAGEGARFELHARLVEQPPARAEEAAGAAESEPPAPRPPEEEPAGPRGRDAEAGSLALPAPEKWYTAREVDVRAEPLGAVVLRYPERLRGTLAAGTVRLRLFIDEHGVVRKLVVAAADPPGLFEEEAKSAWQEVRFRPALKESAPVKSQKLIELTYRPE